MGALSSVVTPDSCTPIWLLLAPCVPIFAVDNLSSDALRLAIGSEVQFYPSGQPVKACSKMKTSLKPSKPQSERS